MNGPGTAAASTRLRFGLLTDSLILPGWIVASLVEIKHTELADFVVILQCPRPNHSLKKRLLSILREAFFHAYTYLDRLIFRIQADPFKLHSVALVFPECPVKDIHLIDGEFARETLDVLWDPLGLSRTIATTVHAKYGVWRLRYGSGDALSQSSPGFREVMSASLFTEIQLVQWDRLQNTERTLLDVVLPTDPRSVAREQINLYTKVSSLPARQLRQLAGDPRASISQDKNLVPSSEGRSDTLPGNLEVVISASRLVRRYLGYQRSIRRTREQWVLAYHWNDALLETKSLRYLVPPRDRFWADPFVIQRKSLAYIFHEEALFSTQRGSIVLSILDKEGRIDGPHPILGGSQHLSYPFIFEWSGEIFMIPESAARRRIELYRCISFPMRWELEQILLDDIAAYDSTLAFHGGRWWLFTSLATPFAFNSQELFLFHADSPMGPWLPHFQNPIKSDIRSSRPAGGLFERDGGLFRPAQDCAGRYGKAISINRIRVMTPDVYEERQESRLSPDWNPDIVGLHTLNRADSLTVIDCVLQYPRRKADPLSP
jgi:hypothetical protein